MLFELLGLMLGRGFEQSAGGVISLHLPIFNVHPINDVGPRKSNGLTQLH
jgi:hypothetical protein